MKPWISARWIKSSIRLGLGRGSAALDCAIRPTSGVRAPRLIRRKAASSTGPPTLSQ
jgi:hypothetical protein